MIMERGVLPTRGIYRSGNTSGVTIKSPEELRYMREAGRVVASTITSLVSALRPGMKTRELDAIASREIHALDAKPSFKGYLGFPATICVSINDEIVHGIPGNRIIQEGDIVSMDVGAIVGGFQGDAAVTVGVGRISPEAHALIETTKEALEIGIKAAKAGARVGDISAAIQTFVEAKGYSVVREYVGHGIGRALHEEPQIPNYGPPQRGPLLHPGMTIAIEPMVNTGGWKTRCLEDKWTVVTLDGSLSAHFEHSIAIADGDAEILTRI